METLEPNDIQKLNHSIQQLYALHNLDTFGVDSLAIVDRLVPSDWPLFHLTNTRMGKITQTFLPNFSGVPTELLTVLERVLSKDRANHPIAQHMPQTLNGAYKLSDFVSQQELYCREGLYQQFLRPLDVEDQMLLFLPNVNPGKWGELAQANTILAGFIINRQECSFTERDRSILNLLRPHLLQVYSNTQKYQQLQQNLIQVQQSLDCLGAIVLDSEGRIQSIAPQAIIWLETYFSRSTCLSHLPDYLWAWVKHRIADFTTKIAPHLACPPLRIQQAGRELTIRLVVRSSGERYLLMLEEQTLSSLNSLEILGLTQRETEVLALIIQGSNNQAIAAQMNVTTSTVRKHLENIYLKLGVKSRTEAIAQTLAKLGFLNSLPLR